MQRRYMTYGATSYISTLVYECELPNRFYIHTYTLIGKLGVGRLRWSLYKSVYVMIFRLVLLENLLRFGRAPFLHCLDNLYVYFAAHTRSRSGVMTNTFKNYINKVKASGLVSEEEASAWLKSHHGEEGESQVFEEEEEGLKKRGRAWPLG